MHAARSIAPLLVLLGSTLLWAGAGTAVAAKRITGKLTVRGYDVVAVAANGKITSAQAKPKFSLRPPAPLVTLQLRTRDGIYGGPIVVGKAKKGKRAIVGVRAGVGLGKVRVNRRRGYAKARVGKRGRDPMRWARAKRGVPIGADKFGYVRSKRAHGGAPGDRDLDGVVNPLDVDVNGNRILDNLDRRADAGSALSRTAQESQSFFSHLMIGPPFEDTKNVNAGSTPGEINDLLPTSGLLALSIVENGAELDCGGFADPNDPAGWIDGREYCTRGGSGRVFTGDQNEPPFPGPPGPDGCCDADGDGQGTMVNNINNPAFGMNMFIRPNATADKFGTGDELIQRLPSGGELHMPIQYSMATVPALVSYDDGQGNSATVAYPIPDAAPGTMAAPFLVRGAQNNTGDVSITVTFWRPQRRPLSGEPGYSAAGYSPDSNAWVDIRGLLYQIGIGDMGSLCPRDAFSESDDNLSGSGAEQPPGLVDRVELAQPPNPNNNLTYTVNLTTCVERPVITGPRGEEPAPPLSLEPGETRNFGFGAASFSYTNGASATQQIFFRRE